MLEIGGAAYTQVRLIHESLRYNIVLTKLQKAAGGKNLLEGVNFTCNS